MTEKEERQFVLECSKEGLTAKEIINKDESKTLNNKKISSIRQSLYVEGLLDEDQVNQKILERRDKKSRERYLEESKRFIKYFKEGYTFDEIREAEKDDSLTISMIRNRKKRLLEEGLISEEEIKVSFDERRIERITDIKLEEAKQFLEFFKSGYQYSEMVEKSNGKVTEKQLISFKKRLIKAGLLTEEEREKGIKKRNKEKLDNELLIEAKGILPFLEEGLSYDEIIDNFKQYKLNKDRIVDLKKVLVKEKLITNEEIKKKALERKRKANEDEMLKEAKNYITMFEKGLSIKEIVESDKEHKLTVDKVTKYKKILAKNDLINIKEVNKQVSQNRLTKMEQKYYEDSIRFLKYFKEGYSISEIKKAENNPDLTYEMIRNRRIYLEGLGYLKDNSKIGKIKIGMKMKQLDDAINDERLRSQGYNDRQILAKLECSSNYLRKIREDYKKVQETNPDAVESRKDYLKEKSNEKNKTEIKKAESKVNQVNNVKESRSKTELINKIKKEQEQVRKAKEEEKAFEEKIKEKASKKNERLRESIVISIAKKEDERDKAFKEEKQRKYEEFVRKRNERIEKEKAEEEARNVLSKQHELHIKAESKIRTDQDVVTEYENVYKSANLENKREEKGIDDVTTENRKKYLDIVEIADYKQIKMKGKYYDLLDDIIMYHPELANEHLINLYLKETLRVNEVGVSNFEVITEKVGDLVSVFDRTPFAHKMRELQDFVRNMERRKDGIAQVRKRINDLNKREEKE